MKANRTKIVTRNHKWRVLSAHEGPTKRAAPSGNGARTLGGDATGSKPVAAALAELDDGELCALIEVTNTVPPIVPGLLAWIGHACDWELNRRACVDFPLQTPAAVIPPDEDVASIAAMMILRARFDQDACQDTGAVVALFDAMIQALTGGEHRH